MEYEYEVNLLDLIKHLLKKWIYILLSVLVVGAITTGYAYLSTKTYYRAQGSVVVLSENVKAPVEAMNIITRQDVVENTLKAVRSNIGVGEAVKNISIKRYQYSDEIIIEYRALTEIEATSFLGRHITNFMGTINEIEGYQIQTGKAVSSYGSVSVGPSKTKYALLGIFGGGVLAVFIIALKYVLDNRVRDKEFVENVLKYNLLSEINSDESGYNKLFANLIYGFPDVKVLTVDSFEPKSVEVAEKLADFLAKNKGRVLYIHEKSDDEQIISRLNNGNLTLQDYTDNEETRNNLLGNALVDKINDYKNQYDYVVIGASHNNEVSATVFDAVSDGTILVITKDKTSVTKATEYKKQLDIVKAKVIGAVFKIESK